MMTSRRHCRVLLDWCALNFVLLHIHFAVCSRLRVLTNVRSNSGTQFACYFVTFYFYLIGIGKALELGDVLASGSKTRRLFILHPMQQKSSPRPEVM
jgi:hypothetical protein